MTFDFKDFDDFLIKNEDDDECENPTEGDFISSPHSNAFLDFNGDCMPDIYLSKISNKTKEHYYEIYMQKAGKFCLQVVDRKLLPSFSQDKSIPLIHFFDVNNDGMIDQVFYHDKQLYIFYNRHKRRVFE